MTSRTRSRLTCRMIAGLFVVVLLASGLFVGLPVAKAANRDMSGPCTGVFYFPTAPGYLAFRTMGTATTTWDNWTAAGVTQMWVNGYAVQVGCARVAWSGPGGAAHPETATSLAIVVPQYSLASLPGYDDDTADVVTWTAGDSYVYQGVTTTFSGSGSVSVVLKASMSWTPPSVSIDSGPFAVDLVDGGTWHATATGGQTPYTYAWAYWSFETVPNYNAGTGQTFAHVFPAGTWTVGVKATDSVGATAYATITVTAASVVGSYEAHFTRSGAYGQYMSVYVTDTLGAYVTISSTANTQFGIYATTGGAYGWVAADYEAVQFVTYTWRWTMSANFGGATSPPPADFWLWSSIHLAVPNVDLVVKHHFVSLSDTFDTWLGPTGNPLTPETTPVPTSVLPDWLQPIYDMFVRLFKALFQPDATEFGKQLAGSWITIASPVPSITPQYTIPFPNPSHLLAPTGDSVNIDFSGIMGYTGYSTYRLIVQVFLDAILVFVVIALVT